MAADSTQDHDSKTGLIRLPKPERMGILEQAARKVGVGRALVGGVLLVASGTVGATSYFARAADVDDLAKRTATLEQHVAVDQALLGNQDKKIDWLTDVTYRQAQRDGLPVAPPPSPSPTPASSPTP